MKTHRLAALAMSTILVTQPVLAQDGLNLGTLILSGGLTPVESAAYGRAATVITEEEIANGPTGYLVDVLRRVPGVHVSRSGSFGGLTQVRLRGHEGNHTLVLIDGVEVAAPNQGEYDFGGLLSSEIERIEVIRGPQSSLYGSQAIGGVISITTKGATEPGFSGVTGFEVGSDGTTEGRLALRYKGDRGDVSFSAVRRDTGGFDISGTPGGEDDGDLNQTYALKGSFNVTDTFRIGGSVRHTDRVSDTDSFNFGAPTPAGLITDGQSNSTVQETFSNVFAEFDSIGGRLQNRTDVSYAYIDRQGKNAAGVRNSDNTGTRSKLTYRGTLALDSGEVATANHLLTLGLEWEYETYKENAPTIVDPRRLVKRTREQQAIVVEYQGSFATGFDVQASVRQDFNDSFEDFTTYAVGGSYTLPNDTTRFHASYGTGVQNPTLVEQFGFFSNFVGNPNLQPEQSKGWDIGIEQQFLDGRGMIDVTYFNEELEDEIGSAPSVTVPGSNTPVNNPGTSDRQGIEVAGYFDITSRLTASLSYTWLDAKENVPNGPGQTREAIEVRRPKNEISIGIDYALPNDKTVISLDATHVSGLYDLDFKTFNFGVPSSPLNFDRVKLDDYTVVDLGLTHDITDRVQLRGRIANLFDENYEELEGYATQGRTVYLGVDAKF